MSTVITSKDLARYASSLGGYIELFLGFLQSKRIAPAQGVPDWDIGTNQLLEEEKIFRAWLRDQADTATVFNRQWKYHFFGGAEERKAFREDWLPPIKYTLEYALRYSLPQSPQQRVRIPDPTDPKNRPRSIRVHFAESAGGKKIITRTRGPL